MKVREIVKLTNKYLAGEQLTYFKLLPFFDEVIDDINSNLDATYPSFTSLGIESNPTVDDTYDFFPDHYIRSVVVIGAASKFYLMDEEGIDPAQDFSMKYRENLFYMTRDFIEHVPRIFRSDSSGGLIVDETGQLWFRNYFDHRIWS